MRGLIICISLIASIVLGAFPPMALTKSGLLSECFIDSNCVRVEKHFHNSEEVYLKLVYLASSLPRVSVINNKDNYWHGVVKSFIFRFPDDLEILHIPSRNIIQVRSASRIGLGDLGVNQKRINKLFSQV